MESCRLEHPLLDLLLLRRVRHSLTHMCAVTIHVNIHPKTLVIKQLQVVSLKETSKGSKVPVDLNDLEDDGTKPPRLTRMRGRPM